MDDLNSMREKRRDTQVMKMMTDDECIAGLSNAAIEYPWLSNDIHVAIEALRGMSSPERKTWLQSVIDRLQDQKEFRDVEPWGPSSNLLRAYQRELKRCWRTG
jgi:hypothetical protein